jgi:hypothetical protein
MAKQNGWFVKKDKTDLVESDGLQQSTLEYPGLSKDKIFEEVDRFTAPIICVRSRFSASSRRCWRTRTFWCAAAAKATNSSRGVAEAAARARGEIAGDI